MDIHIRHQDNIYHWWSSMSAYFDKSIPSISCIQVKLYSSPSLFSKRLMKSVPFFLRIWLQNICLICLVPLCTKRCLRRSMFKTYIFRSVKSIISCKNFVIGFLYCSQKMKWNSSLKHRQSQTGQMWVFRGVSFHLPLKLISTGPYIPQNTQIEYTSAPYVEFLSASHIFQFTYFVHVLPCKIDSDSFVPKILLRLFHST